MKIEMKINRNKRIEDCYKEVENKIPKDAKWKVEVITYLTLEQFVEWTKKEDKDGFIKINI